MRGSGCAPACLLAACASVSRPHRREVQRGNGMVRAGVMRWRRRATIPSPRLPYRSPPVVRASSCPTPDGRSSPKPCPGAPAPAAPGLFISRPDALHAGRSAARGCTCQDRLHELECIVGACRLGLRAGTASRVAQHPPSLRNIPSRRPAGPHARRLTATLAMRRSSKKHATHGPQLANRKQEAAPQAAHPTAGHARSRMPRPENLRSWGLGRWRGALGHALRTAACAGCAPAMPVCGPAGWPAGWPSWSGWPDAALWRWGTATARRLKARA